MQAKTFLHCGKSIPNHRLKHFKHVAKFMAKITKKRLALWASLFFVFNYLFCNCAKTVGSVGEGCKYYVVSSCSDHDGVVVP